MSDDLPMPIAIYIAGPSSQSSIAVTSIFTLIEVLVTTIMDNNQQTARAKEAGLRNKQ